MNEVETLLANLKAEKKALQEKTAQMHKERNELIEKTRADEDKARELGRQIRKLEQPRLAELEKQIGTLEKTVNK